MRGNYLENEKTMLSDDIANAAAWTGPWFPENPDSISKDKVSAVGDREEAPLQQDEDYLQMAESKFNRKFSESTESRKKPLFPLQFTLFVVEEESWKGKWFPVPPGQSLPETPATQNVEDNNLTDMGNSDQICDDGVVVEVFVMTKMKFIKKFSGFCH